MVHFGMCARPDDISKKQNTEMSTNLIPKEVKLTKISESEKNNLRKKSRHNQPPKFKHKQNKRQLSYLGNFALPMSTTANNILNANKKKLFASQIRNQNNYFPLKVKGFYLTNSKLPTVISQQKTTEKCTNTNPIIPEGSTPEYTGQSSTTTNPTSLECTEPESTTKEVTTSILTTPECTDLSSPTQSHTTQNINTPEYSDETKMQSTIDLTTPACTEPESTTKEVTTSILTTPECTDLPTTTESHTTQNVNTPECSDETKTHSTIDLATPECTEPESTTKEVTTSILTTPECTDLPTTTQSHTTQNIKTPECSDETKTYSTFDITTPECTEPEFTTKEVTTSILTTPECTDLPTTTQSHTTQNIKTPECSDETKTYSTFDITTPECTEPEFTTKEVTTSILTTPECTDLPTTTQSHTTQNINTPECSDEIKTHSTIDLITPKSSITEKELEYISPQPDKICNPTTPNCSNQKLTIKKHTLLHNPNQNGYNSHSTSESKPKHSNSEPTRERHGCNGCTTTESDVSSYHTRIELNQQNTAVDETKLKDVRPQIEHLSSNSIKPELCSEKSTLLRTIKCNKTETKTQSPLALHFIDRQNFSPSRYFQRQKSRFVLTHFKKRQLIRMNKLLESGKYDLAVRSQIKLMQLFNEPLYILESNLAVSSLYL